jgi:hypothetical protein
MDIMLNNKKPEHIDFSDKALGINKDSELYDKKLAGDEMERLLAEALASRERELEKLNIDAGGHGRGGGGDIDSARIPVNKIITKRPYESKNVTFNDADNTMVEYENQVSETQEYDNSRVNTDNPDESTFMVFRAYLTSLSDASSPKWNPINYIGRGEDFYIYNGFSRKIQIGFKVAALSEKEMKPMYQKLNYLMGNVMPDYKDNLMRGPIVRMTVGNWIDGQTGILNSVSYTVPQDSPWEISLGEDVTSGVDTLILPHIVEVNMTFTPIGSQTKGANKISKKDEETSHLAQNINDAQYITGSIKAGI